MSERFFAPCPRGLEQALAAELAPLGAHDVAPVDGGVGFGGDPALAYHANLESRIASRVCAVFQEASSKSLGGRSQFWK